MTNAFLAFASEDGRIMVTFNVKDFGRTTTEWAAAGKSHAGCLLIVGIDDPGFGLTPRVTEHAVLPAPTKLPGSTTPPGEPDWA